jgi:hypothetical protein
MEHEAVFGVDVNMLKKLIQNFQIRFSFTRTLFRFVPSALNLPHASSHLLPQLSGSYKRLHMSVTIFYSYTFLLGDIGGGYLSAKFVEMPVN